jgi:hypothetical protein
VRVNHAAAAAGDRDGVATATRPAVPTPEPADVISPELALVDPELAERARALLPSYGGAEDLLEEVPVISPELVLVDPVLAEWARARLPERPLPEPHVAPVEVLAREQLPELPPAEGVQPDVPDSPPQAELEWTPELLWAAAEERNVEERALAARKRQRVRCLVLGVARVAGLAAAAMIVAVAGFLAGASTSQRGSPGSVFNFSAQTAASVLRTASAQAPATASTSVPAERPPRTHVEPPPESRPPQGRTFLWAPVAGALYYEVAFYRAGRRIFIGRTNQARLSLPARWAYRGQQLGLAPGVYRWYVWPIYKSATGQRRGKAVVQSKLTVAGS